MGTETVKSALKDLLSGGKVQKCAWTSDDNGNTSNGTIYISGTKFRQEETTVDDKTKAASQFYSISDGESVYTWGSSMGGKGFKISLATLQNMVNGATTGTPTPGSFDLNKQYDYKCDSWNADESQFVPPKDVTFTDMSLLQQQLKDLQNKFGAN